MLGAEATGLYYDILSEDNIKRQMLICQIFCKAHLLRQIHQITLK